MFAWLMCKGIVPEKDPRVAMPFTIVTVAAQYMPNLMFEFAQNVLRIARKSDPATKLVIECWTAALTIGALAMIGCASLKNGYRMGTLTREDVEFARDLIIETAIEDFAKDKRRVQEFRNVQASGFLINTPNLQDYELSLVKPVLKGLGQVVKQGGCADIFWVTALSEMLDAARVSQAFKSSVLEFFWMDFQPKLLSAKSDMVAALRLNHRFGNRPARALAL